jgi:uncharacterized protein YutE (UPF0331/DUF86 family)
MTNKSVLENKISSSKKYLTILKNHQGLKLEIFTSELILKGAIERYLYLAIQSSIDLAEAFIAYRGFRKPLSYRESFEVLQENQIIPQNLQENLRKMCGFRNIITHDYQTIDDNITLDILNNHLSDIEEFTRIIEDSF